LKHKWFLYTLMLLVVPIAGELKFYPFDVDFRISAGTPAFLFLLLLSQGVHPMASGVLTGALVLLFRMGLEAFGNGQPDWSAAFHQHYPAVFFYVAYAAVYYVTGMARFRYRPLALGVLAVVAEIGASLAELFFRFPFFQQALTGPNLAKIVLIAVIRSFFVLGFYNIFLLRQARWAAEQQRQRHEHVLSIVSNLYVESVQLKKTLRNAELITKDCYDLYRELKEADDPERNPAFARKALRLAGQIHEMKKDNQRIYAGLSKLISEESSFDYMRIEELGRLIVGANEKYARLLGKDIELSFHADGTHSMYHIHTVLTLINNITANAIEAIDKLGAVRISVSREDEVVVFRVRDNGPGIPEKNRELIFHPGFTTKYDSSGQSSTGIGLSYVKETVLELGGSISVESDQGTDRSGTEFTIRLPADSLTMKV
jgi:two-component system sensor histidine kinase YcbA